MGDTNTTDERLRLIVELVGAKQADKAVKKLETNLMTQTQFTKKFAGMSPAAVKAEATKQLAIEKQNKALMAQARIRANLEKTARRFGYKGSFAGMTTAGLEQLNTKLRDTTKTAKNFEFHWLGIMFAGMAVDRVMSKLMRGMLNDYKMFTKEAVTPLSEGLTRVEANWKFLKFAIMEAASPFLASFSNTIADIAMWLGKQDPKVLQGFAVGIIAISAAAKALMIAGQFMLFFNSLKTMTALKTLKTLQGTATGITAVGTASTAAVGSATAGTGIAGFLSKYSTMVKLGGAVLSLYGIFRLVKQVGDDEPVSAKEAIMTALTTGLGVGLLTFNPVAGFLAAGAVLITIAYTNDAKQQQDFLKGAFGTSPELRTGEEAFITGYQGTTLPEDYVTKLKDGSFYMNSMKGDLRKQFETMNEIIPRVDMYRDAWDYTANDIIGTQLPDNVQTFIADDSNGMAALQNEADALNEKLAEPITKTVTVNTVNNSNSVNLNTLS